MNILIIHAHTANRGDESAVKAMCDELLAKYPDINITIALNGITRYPNMPKQVTMIDGFFKSKDRKAQIGFFLAIISKGLIRYSASINTFIKALDKADLVVHAPGGPSIGDIYSKKEFIYLSTLRFAKRRGKNYMFYAPSMGPFNLTRRNKKRIKVLMDAKCVLLRDPISYKYVENLAPKCNPILALDSALQHDFDVAINEDKYQNYKSLVEYLSKYEKTVGLTITDLKWHQKYKNADFQDNLKTTFDRFIGKRISEGYGIVFIPQLYGAGNDESLMNQFMVDDKTFIIKSDVEDYDSYFQQYVISKLFAVVGMRYHSNIFSAKVGTPFISVSYEQKMKGFMESIECSQYCIDLERLSPNVLEKRFQDLLENYQSYKKYLYEKHDWMKKRSHISSDKVFEIIELNQKKVF
ncbi:MAG: polysaccharide pyruvyl transferase family protein [Lachnospiraceae bacterium]|nr:polysaccharide pyruvyl transferase family protein [Lachnospiraceae bacterium]